VVAIKQSKSRDGGDCAEQVARWWFLCGRVVAVVARCGGRGWQVNGGVVHHVREMGSDVLELGLHCSVV